MKTLLISFVLCSFMLFTNCLVESFQATAYIDIEPVDYINEQKKAKIERSLIEKNNNLMDNKIPDIMHLKSNSISKVLLQTTEASEKTNNQLKGRQALTVEAKNAKGNDGSGGFVFVSNLLMMFIGFVIINIF